MFVCCWLVERLWSCAAVAAVIVYRVVFVVVVLQVVDVSLQGGVIHLLRECLGVDDIGVAVCHGMEDEWQQADW